MAYSDFSLANVNWIDQREYYIDNVEKILGILLAITGKPIGIAPDA